MSKIITIENPLGKQVAILKDQLSCDNENVTFQPVNFNIPSKSEFGLEIIYRPLIVGEVQSKFNIRHPELGDSNYVLQLNGLP